MEQTPVPASVVGTASAEVAPIRNPGDPAHQEHVLQQLLFNAGYLSPPGAESGTGKPSDDDAKAAPKRESLVPKDTKDGRYIHHIAERMKMTRGWRGEMDALGGGALPDHIASVFDANGGGGLDPVKRMAEVEHAVRRQQELQAEKRARKKERMKDAVRNANKQIQEGGLRILPEDKKPEDDLYKAISAAIGQDDYVWKDVNYFKTKEEAVGFIMECQPFSFAPVLDSTDAPLPKFDTNHEAAEYVCKMHPVPMSYVSTVNDFKRRLRIRLVDIEEQDTKKTHHKRSRRTSVGRASISAAVAVPEQNRKPWLVEASGTLFERPTSLRLFREAGTKYYIAVSQEVAQTVLQEGYKVQTRCSIPLSATPQEALSVWTRNNQKTKQQTTADNSKGISSFAQRLRSTVLPVVIPPEMEVVTHRKQGFLVRAKELPPSCFRVKKTGLAETTLSSW